VPLFDFGGDLLDHLNAFAGLLSPVRTAKFQMDVGAIIIIIGQLDVLPESVTRLNGSTNEIHVLLQTERPIPVLSRPKRWLGFTETTFPSL